MTTARRGLERRTIDHFRQRLLGERERLLRTVGLTDEELASLDQAEPGTFDEAAGRQEWRGTLARMEGQERDALEAVHLALGRLADGTFGVCESCGGTVPLARLDAMPTATRCLACQAHHERGVSS